MAKDSRFAEIYRQQLMKDKGILGAFASTAGERGKEIVDLRRMLPKSGISGAISQRIFGKSYRSGSVSDKGENARITRVDMNSQITARNTSVLPAMAREMNLTRLNMQKLVKLAGGTPSKTSTFKDKSLKEASTPTIGKPSKGTDSLGNIAGGIFNLGSGLLGGAASMTGSLIGGLGSLVGGMFGGIFKTIGGILSVAGPYGILLMIGAASLMKAIYDNFDFKSLGNLFGNTFDAISKSLKSFFATDGEDENRSFLQIITEKLDSLFGTTKFTEILNSIGNKLKEVTDELQFQIKSIYTTITNHSIAAFKTFSDIMITIAQDMKGIVLSWFDENRTSIYSALGAGAGAIAGPKGIAAGAAAGAAIGELEKSIQQSPEARAKAIIDLQKQIAAEENALKTGRYGGVLISKEKLEANLAANRLLLEQKKAEIDSRNSNRITNLSKSDDGLLSIYQKNLDNINQKNPQPVRINPNSVSGTSTTPTKIDTSTYSVAPYGGYKNRQEFTDALMPWAQKAAVELKVPADAILSQWGLETGWGKRGTIQGQFNYGNIQGTYRESEAGLDAGRPRNFIKYGSMQDFVDDYVKQLKNPRYDLGKEALGSEQFFQKLKKGGYAEDPNYVSSLMNITKGTLTAGMPGKTPTVLPGASTKSVTTPQIKESSFSDTIVTAIAGLLQVSQDTNKQIQAVAAASSKGSESSSAMIESPYDREAFDSLFRFHADIHSSSA